MSRYAASSCLLFAAAACADTDGPLGPGACDPPTVALSEVVANPANVLSSVVTASTTLADSVAVRYGEAGSSTDGTTPAVVPSGNSSVVPVLGLRPSTGYTMQVVAYNACAQATGATLQLTTGVLPADIPTYNASGSNPLPGYVVFAAGSYGLAIDNAGRVVWYHHFTNGPGLNFEVQPNGRYMAKPAGPGAGPGADLVEVTPLNTVRPLGCSGGLAARVHDFIGRPDGSYWLMCDEVRTVDLTAIGGQPNAQVQGTVIQHIGLNGALLFSWSPFDHFPIGPSVFGETLAGSPVFNWTHGNALDLDGDGNLLVSFRNLHEVTKINTSTGAVVWRMGGSSNQFTFSSGSGTGFTGQHGVRATGTGRLLLLDNLGDPQDSRAERYEFDEGQRTVRLAASYASSPAIVGRLGGSTQSLPGGRTLVSFGNGGRVEEYDASGNVVWRIDGNPGYIFRAQRIRSLYTPGVGDPR
ncbi:MAG TPA: arylsulfotransferase family protein [Gemmatimonadaceae bacterium]